MGDVGPACCMRSCALHIRRLSSPPELQPAPTQSQGRPRTPSRSNLRSNPPPAAEISPNLRPAEASVFLLSASAGAATSFLRPLLTDGPSDQERPRPISADLAGHSANPGASSVDVDAISLISLRGVPSLLRLADRIVKLQLRVEIEPAGTAGPEV